MLFPIDKSFLAQLTTDLYCLTLLFPKKEPLRYKIREVADNILEIFVRFGPNLEPKTALEIIQSIDVLDSFFSIAQEQNWVSLNEILKVWQKYASLRQEMEDIGGAEIAGGTDVPQERTALLPLETKESQSVFDFKTAPNNDERQKKILEILKEKGKSQVWELKKIFPEVSKRTLRRDFEYMLSRGLVERMGERNQTFYRVAGTRPGN